MAGQPVSPPALSAPVLSAPLGGGQSYTAQHSHRSSHEHEAPASPPARDSSRARGPPKSPTAGGTSPSNAVLVETKGGKAIAIPKLWMGAAPMNEEAEAGEKEKQKKLLQKHIEEESERHEEEQRKKALERKQREQDELKRTGKHLNGKVKEAPPRANRPPLTSAVHANSAPVMSDTVCLDLHKDASSDPLRDGLPEATELVGEIRARPKQKPSKPPALDTNMMGGLGGKGFPKEPVAGISSGTRMLQSPVTPPTAQPAAFASPMPQPTATPSGSAQKAPPSPPAKKSVSPPPKAATPLASASTPSASVSPPPRPQAPPVPARTPKPVPRGTDPFMANLGQILPGSSSSGMAKVDDGTPRATPRRSLQNGTGNGLLHHKPVSTVYGATPKAAKSPLAPSGSEQPKGSLNGAWIPEASLGIETI